VSWNSCCYHTVFPLLLFRQTVVSGKSETSGLIYVISESASYGVCVTR